MPSLLQDRDRFIVGAAVLGTGLGVLNLAYTSDWGWIPALVMFPALIVRAFWRSMPGWVLLSWVAVPTLVGEAANVVESAYLVVFTALVVAAAGPVRRLDTGVMVVCLVSPFLVWWLGTNDWNQGIGSWIWFSALLTGWFLGHVAGQQWALIDELERTRTRLAETAVAEERQRIARDLHDLVGHSFSVVLLHLSGARMNLASSPRTATEALRQAEEVGRRGMDELRQALLLMHKGTQHAPGVFEPGELEHLVARYREAGMRIDLDVSGDIGAIGPASRIVLNDVLREALTNVAKHARTPEAAVRVAAGNNTVTVRVENALDRTTSTTSLATSAATEAGSSAGAGIGLAGLEHRVAAVEGTFLARADRERWVVEARLPRHIVGGAA
jgi:signal transduction histidine kinase